MTKRSLRYAAISLEDTESSVCSYSSGTRSGVRTGTPRNTRSPPNGTLVTARSSLKSGRKENNERKTEGAGKAPMAGVAKSKALRVRIVASTHSGVSRCLRTVARTGNYVMDCGPGSPATCPRTSSASRLDLRARRRRRSPTSNRARVQPSRLALPSSRRTAALFLLCSRMHSPRSIFLGLSPLGTLSWPSTPSTPASMRIVVRAHG